MGCQLDSSIMATRAEKDDHTNLSEPCGGCGGCGSDCVFHEGVCPATRTHAPNWVAEHLGASSRCPRQPFPALMAGETPGRVPVYTALTHPVTT